MQHAGHTRFRVGAAGEVRCDPDESDGAGHEIHDGHAKVFAGERDRAGGRGTRPRFTPNRSGHRQRPRAGPNDRGHGSAPAAMWCHPSTVATPRATWSNAAPLVLDGRAIIVGTPPSPSSTMQRSKGISPRNGTDISAASARPAPRPKAPVMFSTRPSTGTSSDR